MQDSASQQADLASISDSCSRWTTVLASLVADVEALQQIAGLQQTVHGDAAIKAQYIDLDEAVTSIEQKHQALLEIVREEQRALDVLEQTTDKSVEQHSMLQEILQSLKEKEKENSQANSAATKPLVVAKKTLPTTHKQHMNVAVQKESKTPDTPYTTDMQTSQTHVATTASSQAYVNPYIQYTRVSLKRITLNELQSIPRTIRGRISHTVLSEALVEIETVCRDKYAHYKRPAWWEDEPWEHPWVSEQDLRKSCAFFRSGESTARAILLLLRNLHRLKQVPAKNLEIIYILSV
jgi:hypothetical protein